jgi:hypothetical protein
MTEERRKSARVRLNLTARYDGLSGTYEARLEDISLGGCFVNTPGQVNVGEMITVDIKMSSEWLHLRGEVTVYHPGIGFGVAFRLLTDDQERKLKELIAV